MRTWRCGFVLLMGALVIGWPLAGCGRSAKVVEEETATESETEAGEPDSAGKPTVAKTRKKKKKAAQVPNIGGIPLDAFGDEATLATASNTAAPAPAGDMKPELPAKTTAAVEPKKATPAPEPAKPTAPAAAGAHDWPTVLSGEVIAEETKKIRLRLKESLSNVAKYNESCKEIEADGAVMAALAGIMPLHPDTITWKPKAKFVRDVAANMGAAAKKGTSKANFDPTQAEYEKLNGLLAGDSPAGVGEAAEKVPFPEFASRAPLMRRMEKSRDYLLLTIKTADVLKKEKENVVHEARILAALTKVVGEEGYSNADEDDYKGYIQTILQASLDAANAGQNEDFDGFHGAMEKVKGACEKCHVDYRFAK